MIQQNYSVNDVREIASAGFDAFRIIARDELKKKAGTMSFADRRRAVTALNYLGTVAENPALHFSRAATAAALQADAAQIRAKYKLPTWYDIESSKEPVVMAVRDATPAVHFPLSRDFFKFCTAYYHWEYNNKDDANGGLKHAQQMDGILDYLLDRVNEIRAYGAQRKFMELKNKFKTYPVNYNIMR